jgi:hypothetical protein
VGRSIKISALAILPSIKGIHDKTTKMTVAIFNNFSDKNFFANL